RRAHPGTDVQQGDARDLSRFQNDRFALVMFSYNGIDGLDHGDRRRALEEFHRVIRRDGWLVFSTLNKDGPAFNTRPWRNPDRMQGSPPRRAIRWLLGARSRLPLAINRTRNWLAG